MINLLESPAYEGWLLQYQDYEEGDWRNITSVIHPTEQAAIECMETVKHHTPGNWRVLHYIPHN